MSIPLVQNNDKDAINTSIIAIKRNIERINMLLGLVDSDSPDLSGFATKQELQDAVESLQPVDEVTIDNMQSVTSNAVYNAFSWQDVSSQVTLSFVENLGSCTIAEKYVYMSKNMLHFSVWVKIENNVGEGNDTCKIQITSSLFTLPNNKCNGTCTSYNGQNMYISFLNCYANDNGIITTRVSKYIVQPWAEDFRITITTPCVLS